MWATSQQPGTEKERRRGFTIVELLIVIVVIGILAAIVIVAYNGVTQQARVASIKSDLDGAVKQLAIDQVSNSAYPATLAAANGGAGLKASPGTTYQYAVDNSASPQTFCITATNGTTSYFVSSTNNVATAGACPGQGAGGVAAITNLAPTPEAVASAGWDSGFGSGGAGSQSYVADARFPGGSADKLQWSTAPSDSSGLYIGLGAPGNTTLQSGHTYFLSMRYAASWAAQPSFYIATQGSGVNAVVISRGDGTNEAHASFTASASGPTPIVMSLQSATPLPIAGSTLLGGGFMVVDITSTNTAYQYDDGAATNWVWNGTANASTSTGPPAF